MHNDSEQTEYTCRHQRLPTLPLFRCMSRAIIGEKTALARTLSSGLCCVSNAIIRNGIHVSAVKVQDRNYKRKVSRCITCISSSRHHLDCDVRKRKLGLGLESRNEEPVIQTGFALLQVDISPLDLSQPPLEPLKSNLICPTTYELCTCNSYTRREGGKTTFHTSPPRDAGSSMPIPTSRLIPHPSKTTTASAMHQMRQHTGSTAKPR